MVVSELTVMTATKDVHVVQGEFLFPFLLAVHVVGDYALPAVEVGRGVLVDVPWNEAELVPAEGEELPLRLGARRHVEDHNGVARPASPPDGVRKGISGLGSDGDGTRNLAVIRITVLLALCFECGIFLSHRQRGRPRNGLVRAAVSLNAVSVDIGQDIMTLSRVISFLMRAACWPRILGH